MLYFFALNTNLGIHIQKSQNQFLIFFVLPMPSMFFKQSNFYLLFFVTTGQSDQENAVSSIGIAISHEKRENGKFVDEKFLTGKSDEKNGKLSSL